MTRGLNDIFELLLRKDLPFSFYSKPLSKEVELIVQDTNSVELNDEILKSNVPGFILRPFDKRIKPKYIRADYSGSIDEFLWEKFEKIPNRQEAIIPNFSSKEDLSKKDYINRVEKIVERIKNGELKKMVFSRTKTVSHDKSPLEIFQALNQRYPSAFTYLLRTDDGQIWLGASPEIIVEKTGKGFRTVALAGTVLNEDSNNLFSAKNKKEQILVLNFILNRLVKAGAKNIKYKEPEAHVAVNVTHIKTEITFELGKTNIEDVINIAEELHPTPAVGGMPQDEAMKCIEEFENYDRDLYAGYLGPINVFGETALFVNIRNAQYFDEHLKIYVGGGIIDGSDSESEWQETENKSYLMNQVIL